MGKEAKHCVPGSFLLFTPQPETLGTAAQFCVLRIQSPEPQGFCVSPGTPTRLKCVHSGYLCGLTPAEAGMCLSLQKEPVLSHLTAWEWWASTSLSPTSLASFSLLMGGLLCASPFNDVSVVSRLEVCNYLCSKAIKFQPSPTQIKSTPFASFLTSRTFSKKAGSLWMHLERAEAASWAA